MMLLALCPHFYVVQPKYVLETEPRTKLFEVYPDALFHAESFG